VAIRSPRSDMPKRTSVVTVVALLCLVLSSCTPKIPNAITQDEMDVYRQWLLQRFAKEPPKQLYLDNQTFVFDPLSEGGCGNILHREDHVSWSLMKALHALHNVDYELDMSSKVWNLPWQYRVLDLRHFPAATSGLHVIAFSRVAFDSSGKHALFSFSDSCAFGQCGNGGVVVGNKDRGSWRFTTAKGCSWVY
jgi:hypothetical protein